MKSHADLIPKIALLAHAFALIDGIPDKQVSLRTLDSHGKLRTTKQTVSCVCTWLARHRDFQLADYTLAQSNYDKWCYVARSHDLTKGRMESQANVDYAADLFGLDYRIAWALFSDRGRVEKFDPKETDTLSDSNCGNRGLSCS